MAVPGNRHYANCIGALSFPIVTIIGGTKLAVIMTVDVPWRNFHEILAFNA